MDSLDSPSFESGIHACDPRSLAECLLRQKPADDPRSFLNASWFLYITVYVRQSNDPRGWYKGRERKDLPIITLNTDDNPRLILPFLTENKYISPSCRLAGT